MLLGIVILLVILVLFRYGPAAPTTSSANGINVLEQVELAGVKQWISIRGTDINNPVLLFLHGGPGSANLAKLRVQCPALEEHFVVVSWDQRGAGKTYTLRSGVQDLTLAQLRADTHALVTYLRDRFGGEKIYLMGFSWGTALGLWTVHDYPEDFHAFISVGQMVNWQAGEALSLAYVQQIAREQNHKKAQQELTGIDPAYLADDWYAQQQRQRHWLLAFGGVYHTTNSYNHEAWMLFTAPEYSLVDFALWPLAQSQSLKQLTPELRELDFAASVPQIEVPIYFLVGRHDYNTPFELTQLYYEQLQATQGKHFIWFEESAHDIFFDQPETLVNVLMGIKNR